MKLDFDKVLKKLLPDGPTIADAKVTFGWCKRRERMFADGEDTTMWCNECVQAVPAATWWEDEVVGGGPLQRVCVRVHQSVCAAMDVERKNSALGSTKSKARNLMGQEKFTRSARHRCNQKVLDKMGDSSYQEQCMDWEAGGDDDEIDRPIDEEAEYVESAATSVHCQCPDVCPLHTSYS